MPITKLHMRTQIDSYVWLNARRFRLIAADGQSRVFAVDTAGYATSSDSSLSNSNVSRTAVADGLYSKWVRELARVALVNLRESLDSEATGLRSSAERDAESIAESRRIQASLSSPPLMYELVHP
jgi:hypothetical protein